MKAGASSTSTLSWKSSARSWHHININTKLEIFSTRLASHQHQQISTRLASHNINTKLEIFSTRLEIFSITSTSTRSWKYSAQGWHHINISTKLKYSAQGWHHINIS
jgi:hypothetical protein